MNIDKSIKAGVCPICLHSNFNKALCMPVGVAECNVCGASYEMTEWENGRPVSGWDLAAFHKAQAEFITGVICNYEPEGQGK